MTWGARSHYEILKPRHPTTTCSCRSNVHVGLMFCHLLLFLGTNLITFVITGGELVSLLRFQYKAKLEGKFRT